MSNIEKLANDLLVGFEARIPTGLKIKNKQVFVKALTFREESICKSRGMNQVNGIQKGADDFFEDEEVKEEYKESMVKQYMLQKACVDSDGNQIFESMDEIGSQRSNVLDSLFASYVEERCKLPIDQPLTNKIIADLRKEVKKNPIIITELSRTLLMILMSSMIEEDSISQKDSKSSGISSKKPDKKK